MKNFDNASTTKISKSALDSYNWASEFFYNPSSLYAPAVKGKNLIEEARQYFLKTFKAKLNSTFIFTSSATESNNAVFNSCFTRKDKTYLIGSGEHSSIYEQAKNYLQLGYDVKFIPLTDNGGVDILELEKMLNDKVAFVSVMHVSNETGAINDITKISKMIKTKYPNVIIHSDGVQAVGKVEINLKESNVDYYTISAHKINGPKGVGALYIANPNKFKPLLLGGGQEMNLRSGTENIPGIVAFKTALENIQHKDFSQHKQAFLNNLTGDFKLVSDDKCVNNIISICYKSVRGETIVHMLEDKGYLIGTGSSCNSKAKSNRILSQIVQKEYLPGAIRVSFDESVTIEDCSELAKEISLATQQYIERIKR